VWAAYTHPGNTVDLGKEFEDAYIDDLNDHDLDYFVDEATLRHWCSHDIGNDTDDVKEKGKKGKKKKKKVDIANDLIQA
jgi:hypothetical protein